MKYFFLLIIFPISQIFSQTDSLISTDFQNSLRLAGDYYTAPLNFDSKDWINFSASVGISGLASLADKEIRNFSQEHRSNFADAVFSIDKYYYIEFVAGSIVAFYGYGLLDDNNKIRKLSVKLAQATILASSITLVTKTVVGRARPYEQESQYYFKPFTIDNDYNSFPSGHTTLAFAYSAVMANEVDNVFWKIGWYSLAGLVGYARIYHNQHWFSDVLMGAAIGYFSGEFVCSYNTNDDKTQLIFYPLPSGFALQLRF